MILETGQVVLWLSRGDLDDSVSRETFWCLRSLNKTLCVRTKKEDHGF